MLSGVHDQMSEKIPEEETESLDMTRNGDLLAPPRALISRNPLMWARFFGPGAVIASVNVGSGEVLFPARSGAIFGYRLLWVFLGISILKWVLAYSSMRHMVISGAHPFDRWNSLPGPRGWLPLFMVAIAVCCLPIWNSFLQGILGTVSTWIFGGGDHYLWATLWVAVSLVLLALGGYRFLEKAQLVMLGLMLVCVFVAVFYVRPDWLEAAKGLFVPFQRLAYPDWLFDKLPDMRDRSVWVEISVYFAALGGQSFDYLAYASFLRDKRWGRCGMGPASAQELERIAERRDHPARIWVRAAVVDTVASFGMIVLIAGAFAILGAVILQPQQLVPDGVNLLNYQAAFLTVLSPWLLPLYQIAVFLAFFGSVYAGPELGFRIVYEYLVTFPRWRDRLPMRKLRWVVLLWTLCGGLAVLWLSRPYPGVQLIDIITPAGIYSGVLSCGFYCLANPWADWRFLPASLRMPKILAGLNIFAGVLFGAMGLKALWEYDGYRAYLILAALLLASIFLASRLAFLRTPNAEPSQKS